MDQSLSKLQGELHSIHPYNPETTPLIPLPTEPIPVFVTQNLPLHPHYQHVQLSGEAETSESEPDEEMLQLTFGIEDCHIEFQKKLPIVEAEFLSMPFDSHGRIPIAKWPPEKSIGYEAFAKRMAKLDPKPDGATEPLQHDQPQMKPSVESPTPASSRQPSTGQYARKTGVPAYRSSKTTGMQV